MKRQGLIISIKELNNLIDELWSEADFDFKKEPEQLPLFEKRKFQINIINKEGLSDTWKIEGSIFKGKEKGVKR